jgi:hypothetical protein
MLRKRARKNKRGVMVDIEVRRRVWFHVQPGDPLIPGNVSSGSCSFFATFTPVPPKSQTLTGVYSLCSNDTLAPCLGVASKIKGSLVWNHLSRRGLSSFVNLRHPSGELAAGVTIDANGEVLTVKVVRTLVEGW